MVAFLALSGQVSGTLDTQSAPSPISMATLSVTGVVDERLIVNLSSGDNTITLPTGTLLVILQPPAANAQTLGLGASAALPIDPTAWSAFKLRASTASIVVNAGGAVTGFVVRCLG